MAPTVSKLTKRPLSSQTKEILYKLNTYFKDLNDKDMSSVVTSAQLVATSMGIPLSTVKKVLLEVKEEKAFDDRDAAIDGLSERFIINTGSDESSDESEDEDAMSGEEL
ncbi:unnamed protein product [Parnassius apollo]|uniref:(apollo) hypothetical protein n=1 Tax=Parnassius apollo TaxID=110799 RepID=A0A8S3Y6Q4_PARAO|nr:unnamed protein product [Parnassius apollo]